ncbi:MAG: hypothetical protein RLZZ303_3778 [Candidatus Hydrogenedentota bacterium]|jgi:hypothetical protein
MLVALAVASLADAQVFGRENVLRGAQTARYEINIQKSALLDARLANGAAVIEDAWCGVVLQGDPQPRRLKLNARASQRDLASTRLGQGKSLLLGSEDFLYAINTFETQPFFTLRMAYENSGKKALSIERLIVLAGKAGKESGLLLGGDPLQARMLAALGADPCALPPLSSGSAEGRGAMSVWNPTSGRVIVVGFLGAPLSAGRFSVAVTGDTAEEAGAAFSFEWVPDAPVTLQPGDALELPPLYISIAETNPAEALRRYGRAFELSLPEELPGEADGPGCESWSFEECLTAAAHRFFIPARLLQSYPCATPATNTGSTLAALLDGSGLGATAHPVGLFDEASPHTWSVPITTDSGYWQVFALFNPDSTAPATRRISLPETYQTVYDYWAQRYLGTAADHLQVEVPPGGVRVLCLRAHEDRPMIIGASDIDGGAARLLASSYEESARTLAVKSQGGVSYKVLMPEGWQPLSASGVELSREDRVLTASVPAGDEPCAWSIVFAPEAAP